MMQQYKKNSHCSYCGREFAEQVLWPRQCNHCLNESYSNPLPCALVFIEMRDGDKTGFLVQKRNIEPKKGHWALCGGYMNNMETWQQTAARETYEEVGLETEPEDYTLLSVRTSPGNGNLLLIGKLNYVVDVKDFTFVPNSEVTEVKVIYEPIELAFPIQTEMLLEQFNKQ